MASGPITSWQIDGETMEIVKDFILGGSKITAGGDCSQEIKRRLLFGRKAVTNLDSILKNRDITLPTKVCLVKAMVFPCESVGGSVVSDSLRPPRTVAHQTPLSMRFTRQEYWKRLPFLSPRDLPNPGIEPVSPTLKILYHLSPTLITSFNLIISLKILFLITATS